MTFLKFIFAGCILILVCSFISPSFNWYKYEDKDCEILFPAIPKAYTATKETSLGKITFYLNVLKNGQARNDSNNVYEFLKTVYPSDDLMNPTKEIAESLFKGFINNSLKQVNGKLLSKKDIKMGNYYGKEVEISLDNDSKFIKLRCYLAKAKVFVVQIIASSDKHNNSSATTFFESFKLK